MKKILSKYFTLLMLAGTVACSQSEETFAPEPGQPSVGTGREVVAYLPLPVVSLERSEQSDDNRNLLSRAPAGVDEEAINDIWIFQFGAADTDDERLLVSPPYYLSREAIDEAIAEWDDSSTDPQIAVPLIESAPGEVHLVAFAANINSKEFSWSMSSVEGQRSSYADLKERVFLLKTEEDSYGGANNNMIMSGRVFSAIKPEIVLDAQPDDPADGGNNYEQGVPLYRSVGNIELNLSIEPGVDFRVLSVQLRNIPSQIDIFDDLIARDENLFADLAQTYPREPFQYIDYDPITNEGDPSAGLLSMGDATRTFSWYVPRNMRGQTKSFSPLTKTLFAPKGATYIEVVAINRAENDRGVIYRIYPGVNDVNDHSVLGNFVHRVSLNITGDDEQLQNDSRVEQYDRMRFDGNNNSFILNPPTIEGMGRRYFEIPVTQVNRYWSQMWDGYGKLNEDILKSDTEWQVDLLWQDAADIVRDVNDPAKGDQHVWLEKSTGIGGDDFFSVSIPYGAKLGNFSIALRPVSGGAVEDRVLWSWHLWVTDYNPDEYRNHTIDGHKFTYPVAGGEVERLGGSYWGYDTSRASTSNNWNNYAYNPASTQPYTKSFLMDRSIGALGTGYSTGGVRGRCFYYQFGRKDPFPSDIAIYNINGVALSATAPAGFAAQHWEPLFAGDTANNNKEPIAKSVGDPVGFIGITGGWTSDPDGFYNGTPPTPEYVAYMWRDPLVKASMSYDVVYSGKSIYDPCPPGWKVPTRTAIMTDFRNASTGYTVNFSGHGRGAAFGSWSYGIRYWPYIRNDQGEAPVEGVIEFPAFGYRSRYGSIGASGSDATYWSANPDSSDDGFRYYFTSTNYYSSYDDQSVGMPVRCVTMEE